MGSREKIGKVGQIASIKPSDGTNSKYISSVVVQSRPTLCEPMYRACQSPLPSIISQSLLKFMSVELVMLCNHLILYHAFLLLPSIFPSIRVFSIESALGIRWPKYWSFNFSNSPTYEYSVRLYF